ncbi:polysaccharide deacetylase family protein [Kitasatospora sp. NPDC049258]|uniref:polysaccharide deacetylase family protein n=1 Tax=Kitasatospora sp. NPDC049258 TaxID=3155394 RepID=UPI0034291760
MTVDRRTLLRAGARIAGLAAGAATLTACGGERAAPSAPSPAGSLAARPRPADPADGGSPGATAPSATAPPASGPAASGPATAAEPTANPALALPPLAAGTPEEVINGSRSRPQVALTFHGQGDPAIAERVLQTAEQHGARLTVLVVGSWLDEQPQVARRILDGGHELGNHTQNHLNISALSAARIHAEIAECADRLEHLTGSIGRWFRPSATQYATATVREQAKLVGYQHCLSFDVDPIDYADPGADRLQRRLLGAVRNGSVVALHLGHQGTADAMPGILAGLAERGLGAVTASQLCS